MISLAGFALPSLGAYRLLFAICAGSAVIAAVLAFVTPRASTTADAALQD
jgi:hypothetical protein